MAENHRTSRRQVLKVPAALAAAFALTLGAPKATEAAEALMELAANPAPAVPPTDAAVFDAAVLRFVRACEWMGPDRWEWMAGYLDIQSEFAATIGRIERKGA